MKKILSVLFASTLVLSACGNQDETEKASEKKPSKSTVENKKKIKKKSLLKKNNHQLRVEIQLITILVTNRKMMQQIQLNNL